MWKSDGTTAGTVTLSISGQSWSTSNTPSITASHDGTVYFRGYDSTNKYALWKSEAPHYTGSVMVKDTYTGSSSSHVYGPYGMVAVGDTIFFNGYDSTNKYTLWKSDGTATGTVMVKNIHSSANIAQPQGPVYLTAVGDIVYFRGYDNINDYALWKSDGTAAGTMMVKDTYPASSSSTSFGPVYLNAVDDIVYFRGKDANGYGLWKSDGTEVGTVKIDINLNPLYDINYFSLIGDTLYFKAYENGTNQVGLWGCSTQYANLGITAINEITYF